MKSYQFINYHENLLLEKIVSRKNNDVVICFDLEDSIKDYKSVSKTNLLKVHHRKILNNILFQLEQNHFNAKIGIRTNEFDSPEFWEDLAVLVQSSKISSIFVPKISSAKQVQELVKHLRKQNIHYEELILVIESREGLQNLSEILFHHHKDLGCIAFGHCDFNLEIQQFPFFHQDTREYWNWVNEFSKILKPYAKRFINSPFLELGNEHDFHEMLTLLRAIAGENVGQITLTKNQSEICISFKHDSTKQIKWKKNRLNLSVPKGFAEKFVFDFETNNASKGFSINQKRVLLSPQEYKTALQLLKFKKRQDKNFTFVGGCFPVQGKLPFEALFHQQLKRKLEQGKNINFNINIIRYERFNDCLEKIKLSNKDFPNHILVFSVRPEPFLRIIKLYYKYYNDKKNKKQRAFNLPFFRQLNSEKFDLLSLNERFSIPSSKDTTAIKKILIDLNYLAGNLIGNQYFALKSYLKLLTSIIQFCQENKIQLIILGPPIRSNTYFEKIFSLKLNRYVQKKLKPFNLIYLRGDEVPLDKKNIVQGVFANSEYHTYIADELEKVILKNNLIDELNFQR